MRLNTTAIPYIYNQPIYVPICFVYQPKKPVSISLHGEPSRKMD